MSTDPLLTPYGGPKRARNKNKADNAVLGFLAGIAFPLLGMVILFFLWPNAGSIKTYLQAFVHFSSPYDMNQASKVVSLAMIANLAPFYFFLNRKSYQTVKGILVSMLLFVLMIVLYKFVWS